MSIFYLAGDVGGTKTALELLDSEGKTQKTARFESAKFADLSAIVLAFLAESPGVSPTRAAFGVAGPVVDGACRTTNLPWHLEESSIQSRCGFSAVRLLNDFEATAYGVLQAKAESVVTLQVGMPREHGAIAVIGAGTGLGEAFLVWSPSQNSYIVMPSEGGHCDFAPRDDIEIELLRYLRHRFGRVSWERVISGQGIVNVYNFLRDAKILPENRDTAAHIESGDAAAVIGKHALAGTDALCMRAIDIFVASYGAEAGNMALKGLTTAGVYLAGGIAPKLLSKFQDGTFLRAYRDKGRLSHLVEKAPVHIVLDQEAPLHGAAYFVRQLM